MLFDAAGVCPSCHIHGDAPVTAADTARIEADKVELARARDARPADKSNRTAGVLVGVIFGFWGFVLVHLLAQDPETKRGATFGFLGRLVGTVLIVMGMAVAGAF